MRERFGVPALVPLNPIDWVADPGEVAAVGERLAAEPVLGLDVETTLSPPPVLCTVQLALPGHTYVIDALASLDLGPIFRVLEDPVVIKIIHYAPFETSVLGRRGIKIRNIVDTFEVSQRLRGRMSRYEHSLGAVCLRELGGVLDKSCQTSDWARRPLSAAQLTYAALDAEILLRLYELFNRELTSPGIGAG